MTKRIVFIVLTLFLLNSLKAQIIIIPVFNMPEHGFLPGKEFRFYPTINKFDFKGLKLRVEVYDDRKRSNLIKTQCSDIEFTGTSEFVNPNFIYKVSEYIDTLFRQSGAKIDPSYKDTVQIWFQGIDARLIGFGYIRVHGLCQMKIKYKNSTKIYCIDITDADKNSPIGPNAIVTRKTATRKMASASIREVIEQFFNDLNLNNEQVL
jgi:hypothetical protein